MSLSITNRGGRCAVCRENFEDEEYAWTHEGAGHDGHHETCLELVNGVCPYDKHAVDFSMKNRTVTKLNKAMTDSIQASISAIQAYHNGDYVGLVWEAASTVGALTGTGIEVINLALITVVGSDE